MNNKQQASSIKKNINEYSFFKNKNGDINSDSLSIRAAKGSVADGKENYTESEKKTFKDFVNEYV